VNISDLKLQARWVCYDANKAPINARTGHYAKSTDPKTWTTYAVARAAADRLGLPGVGVVFNGDGIVGIDLDDALTPDVDEHGTPIMKRHGYAEHLMGLSPSYTEVSPSGTGLHIIGTAKIPRSIKEPLEGIGVEVYDTKRYFTWTEDIVGDCYELNDIQDAVNQIFDDLDHVPEPEPDIEPDHTHDTSTPQNLDKWIAKVIANRLDTAVRKVKDAPDGFRHETRIRAARLIGGYMESAEKAGVHVLTDTEAINALLDAQPPAKEAHAKERLALVSGLKYGRAKPCDLPMPKEPIAPLRKTPPTVPTETTESVETVEDEETYHLTDLGNGRRLVRACGDKLCYVAEWKQWLVWDGRRWAKGDDAGVVRLAHRVALDIYIEIADEPDSDRRKDITKWAVASESAMRIDAMIKSARPYLTKAPNIFDTHAHLLNVANGTINLQTMKMAEHDPAQFLTKIVDVEYDEHASMSPRWAKFLRTIFDNDNELEGYVQRAVGYTLTGHTDEHCLFFCYGDGANGKSTFMKALEIISGEFSTTASIEALLEKRNDGDNATPTVAGLVGMRLATAQEMPDGKRFDESLIKSITGGDTISARVLYGSIFKFVPTHTLWLTGNHKPRITGTDAGIWRRIRIVPFIANIPEDQRRDSREIAKEFHEDASAILQWAVLGAYLWYKSGLGSCEAVDRATTEYRGEEDIVARFIQTMCVIGESKRVAKTVLYAAWKEWAEDEGERGAAFKSQRWVLRQLETRKIVIAHDRRFVHGIGLVEEREESLEPMAQLTRGQRRRAEA
jgi:putative DNA primase/helicase